ncbi:Chemotaxis protein methyltransferase Cher2 [Moorella thermoacetica]|uniref:protein-glutamate O-methyltransferase n=1 Tax=Neomoorella thermoacetica TaxID=1525 RepID=A0AAC9HIH4_NEOTH|nr:protein-glutamate O-methyltransferase CheR [Moorella thermoacetica]AOQ24488.1 Chemotaxis protein methyltransferase Cher2 [Moorella thermoacetica]TYL07650.1 Chemotaxis protein methyltransferase Cher2 [Moorella thermoacetica]
MTKAEFERLREYIYRESGIYFEDNKVYYVEKRVEQQMEKYGFKDFTAYLGALRFDSTGKMRQELLNSLTINETYFFREYEQLKCLAEEVVPLWCQNGAGRQRVRIWCAGCASGEEAYTLAIVMQEMAPDIPWEIYATDIDTEVLDKAEKGIYNHYAIRQVPEVYFKRYFSPFGDNYTISSLFKQKVKFCQLNLVDDAGMRKMKGFHAIFCRNVLIYFDDLSRRRVALHFYQALEPGGYVFLGHSESMSRITTLFKPVRFKNAIIYQK